MEERKLTKKERNNLKKAQENIEQKRQLPQEELDKINLRIFHNILVAIVVAAYFYFINLGSINIPTDTLVVDLKVFSVIMILITILIFEYSYKKDSGIFCIFGIESLFISLATLFLAYLYAMHDRLFQFIVAWVSLAFAMYYVIKSIVIYIKMKKIYLKSMSDINDILKKGN